MKTKIPSEVAGSESELGSCRLNPFVRFAVTIPGTFPNVCPRRGETWAAPWISWMNVGGGGGASVVKLNAKFPSMLFGGSTVSWSVTWAARTVTVQLSENAKSTVGSSVNVVGPPVWAAACEPLVAQPIVYQGLETSTGSLNVIVMSVLKATPVAPASGEVAVTAGALSPVQKWSGDVVLRGAGASASKSVELLSLSVQPAFFRKAAVAFESVGAAAPSKKFAPS